jgi:FMN phosphatase YigB (HAD superfamily)
MSDEPAPEVAGAREDGRILKNIISTDVFHTLLIPAGEQSRDQMVMQVVKEITGREVGMSPTEHARKLSRIRTNVDKKLGPNVPREKYWGEVNPRMYRCDTRQAMRISERIINDDTLYTVSRGACKFFHKLFSQKFRFENTSDCHIVAASNAPSKVLNPLLRTTGLFHFFHWVVSPEDLKGAFKPSLDFYRNYLAKISNADYSRVLHFGNSPRNDVIPAAKLGIDVCWLRSKHEILTDKAVLGRVGKEHEGHVFIARSFEKARELIDAKFVSPR